MQRLGAIDWQDRWALGLGVWAAALAIGCAVPAQNGDATSAEQAEPAARVGGETISLEDVDRRIRQDLFDETFDSGQSPELHTARRETLERMIQVLLLEQAAAEAGMTPDEWLDEQVRALPPVTDAEVEAFFEENESRFGDGVTFDELADRIRTHLERRQRHAVLTQLRERSDVTTMLSRPRFEVAASGPSVGPADAPIVMIEFSDYECPYCGRVEPTVHELLKRYPERLRLVYRHHPLSFHPNARPAASAAVCAEAQGHFWEYHALLFSNQRALGSDQLLLYAEQVGLDLAAFETCRSSEQTSARIDQDVADAMAVGASGTPAFFINGVRLTGAQPIEGFEDVIREELDRLAQ